MVIFADDAGRASSGVSVADGGIGEATSVLSAGEVVYALHAGTSAITGIIDATSVGEATIIALTDIRDTAVCSTLDSIVTVTIVEALNTGVIGEVTGSIGAVTIVEALNAGVISEITDTVRALTIVEALDTGVIGGVTNAVGAVGGL